MSIKYDGTDLPDSPFPVEALHGCDPTRVKAYGPGLEKGIVDEPNEFTVSTKNAGAGGLGLAIEGPSEAVMDCADNKDGTATVEYTPTEEGDYDIAVKFGDEHIPGSPFKVSISLKIDSICLQGDKDLADELVHLKQSRFFLYKELLFYSLHQTVMKSRRVK